MPARTGAQFIAGLQENPPNIYINGKKVEDVTAYPGFRNGINTMARLYDMQHDAKIRDEMTYTSPTSGDRVGLSFIKPTTSQELEQRRVMITNWARVTKGMMGRTPDFLNVSFMAMAAAGDYFGQNRPEFKKNIQDYYEHIRENDLVLTHTLVNLQRSRVPVGTVIEDSTDIALSVVKETDSGIVVNGARLLATLPLSAPPGLTCCRWERRAAHLSPFLFLVPLRV